MTGARPLGDGSLVIAVVGGDEREREIARLAAATGADVRAYGFPWPPEGIPGVRLASDPAEAMTGAHVALFPIPGIGEGGALFVASSAARIVPDAALLRLLAPGARIVVGRADRLLKKAAAETGVRLLEYEDDQELMLLRGPAIVEGALRLAIENTDVTIHGSLVVVVGYGNIGSLLALTLVRLGARVHVAARNPVQRAHARAIGAVPLPLEDLPGLAPDVQMLFSTVPVRIVDAAVLRRLTGTVLVMDLAAPPGGVDLELAKELGHRAIWARGMGARAPVTVGRSQWTGIERRIADLLDVRRGRG